MEVKMANELVGKYFHSFTEDRKIRWQGQIIAEPKQYYYIVQLFSWIDGRETNQEIVEFKDIVDWKFYDSAPIMCSAYKD